MTAVQYTFRPLRWDQESTPWDARRSRYTFKAKWSDTLALLATELDHLDAQHVVIEADFREYDIRADGMIRANARQPDHPGVRLAFDSKYGPLVYATDAHELWQHNVRAIALSLQALRSVDRYGVTRRAEQYTGWKAIGSGMPMPAARMTRDEAAVFVSFNAVQGGWPAFSPAEVLRDDGKRHDAYRLAARRLHPDAGGSTAEFQRLQDALRVLGE